MRTIRVAALLAALLTTVVARAQPTTAPAPASPRATVVWLSIDGFRHDYLRRLHPPTLARLAAEGAFSTRETPIFPSLTFPNHIAQVTGTTVDGHGIPMNAFFDEATGKAYSFPDSAALIRAEPIWVTAERQTVRTMCVDWPMSHAQAGPVRAAHFDAAFDPAESDGHRLDRVVDLLNADRDAHPYRLVMSYLSGVDHAGHAAGPTSQQVADAVAQADRDVDRFLRGVTAWFDRTHGPADELVVLLTTDHGMTPVTQMVNLDRLLGVDLAAGVNAVTSGPIATLHLKGDRADAIVRRLAPYPFLTAWKSADVPAAAHFADPSRVGQVVVLLRPGYSFARQRLATTLPAPRDAGGMHGYDPAASPDMQGAVVLWRRNHPMGGRDLGPISNTQWDATVCQLLAITPPPSANPKAVELP